MADYIRDERVLSYGALFDRADNDGNGVITPIELSHALEVRLRHNCPYHIQWVHLARPAAGP